MAKAPQTMVFLRVRVGGDTSSSRRQTLLNPSPAISQTQFKIWLQFGIVPSNPLVGHPRR